MNYSIYRFTLDIHKTKSQVSIPVLFHDTGIQFYISLTDGGKPYFIGDGCRAVFAAKKADGATLFNDCIIEDNTRIRYDFTEQTTNREGMMNCEIRLYGKDGNLITTPAFVVVVDTRVVYDDDVMNSYSESTTLENIISSEESRAEEELKRVDAEAARETVENARVIAEEERVIAENARAAAEEARSAEEGARVDAEAERAANEAERAAAFASMLGSWVAYSMYEDGTDYTWTWSEGQRYIGIANGKTMPQDKTGFVWSKFVDTGVFVGSGDMPEWCDLQIDPDGEVTEIVQECGQSKVNVMSQKAVSDTFANALKGSKSGAAIFLDDTSPVEHEIVVKVSGVDDLSAVKVVECGKNLIPYPYTFKDVTGGVFINNNDGTITANGTITGVSPLGINCGLGTFILQSGTYTISSGVNTVSTLSVRLARADNNDWIAQSNATTKTFTLDKQTKVICYVIGSKGSTYDNVKIYPMLEVGNIATDYVRGTESIEHTVDADGAVKGIMGKGEDITLYTDTAGALIECSYNKDANKVIGSLIERLAALEAAAIN